MNTGRILLCAVVVLCACTPFAAAHTVIGGSSGTVTPGSAGSFLLGIGDVENCEGIALTLAFDPGLLSITGIEAADPASGTRVIFMTDNDAGTARIVVTCPEGITVATDECEPVLKVSYTAGDATGDATVEIISATR
ncbi:MAG: hypothetical protein GKC04_08620, partial [Methanomicrobiales archaeon]|nr:hypothetical protein [Methanomicrobiales archaeon]